MKKLSINLRSEYISFKAGFECELEATNNLIIISGVNGTGKSQLGEIISGLSSNSSVEFITASGKAQIDPKNIVYENINGTINNAQNIRNLLSSDNYLGSPFVNPDSHISIHQKIRTQVEQYETITDEYSYRICKAIMENTSKTWDQMSVISDDEIDNQLKALNLNDLSSPFANTLQNIFNNYAVGLMDKLFKGYNDGVPKEGVDEEYRNKFGFDKMEPWKFLNQALLEFNLDYEFIEPKVRERIANIDSIKIKNKTNDFIAENGFNFLSSGEKTILSLLFSLMNTKGIKPQVIVLDEYDATLNPSLTEKFYKILEKYFISKDVLVIIITHSIATISMAPDYASFYEVFKKDPRIVKVEKDKYSDMQKALIKYYETEENLRKLVTDLNVQIQESDKKFILLVEGESDKIILENAWKVLYEKQEKQFGIQNSYSAGCINRELGNEHLFNRNASLTFIGMFDFDAEGYNRWNGLTQGWKKFENNIFFKKHETYKGFAFLLPVPDCRKDCASEELKNTSEMPIEFLFEDEKITKYCCDKLVAQTKVKTKSFKKDKKVEFAKSTECFTKEDFKNFIPIFDLIKKIISNSKEGDQT